MQKELACDMEKELANILKTKNIRKSKEKKVFADRKA